MKIYVGTIDELKGQGYEILVDSRTRNGILAHFYDGKLIGKGSVPFSEEEAEETTLVLAETA